MRLWLPNWTQFKRKPKPGSTRNFGRHIVCYAISGKAAAADGWARGGSVARRPSGTTDGGRTLDEPRTRRRAGRAPGTNVDHSAEPLYHSERWGGIPVPGVEPEGFLFYSNAPGEFEELATAHECAAFARWMRETESASGLRTDE